MWRRSAEYCEEKPGIARGRYESCRSCRCLFQDARSFAKSGFSSSSFGMVVVVWLPRCRFRFSHQNADDRRWDCGVYLFVTGEIVFPLWALIILLLLLSVCSSRSDVFGNQKSEGWATSACISVLRGRRRLHLFLSALPCQASRTDTDREVAHATSDILRGGSLEREVEAGKAPAFRLPYRMNLQPFTRPACTEPRSNNSITRPRVRVAALSFTCIVSALTGYYSLFSLTQAIQLRRKLRLADSAPWEAVRAETRKTSL